MTDKTPRPVNVTPFPNGQIGIVWSDGHESILEGHALRCACSCATCVDEMSGQKMLRDESVPRDVGAVGIHPVGNYGLAIHWSDGHDTGIYTFDRLRGMCVCEECRPA
jgi:ATP-binding protein involved in chromosome partitioning